MAKRFVIKAATFNITYLDTFSSLKVNETALMTKIIL